MDVSTRRPTTKAAPPTHAPPVTIVRPNATPANTAVRTPVATAMGCVLCFPTSRPWWAARTPVRRGTGQRKAMASTASEKTAPLTPTRVPKTQSPRGVKATAAVTAEKKAPVPRANRRTGSMFRPSRIRVAATCWTTRSGLYRTPHSAKATENPASAAAGLIDRARAAVRRGLVAVRRREVAARGA